MFPRQTFFGCLLKYPPMRRVQILIADDHAILRAGLRALFEAERDMRVVGEASELREILRVLRASKTDVVVMGPDLPGAERAEAIERIRRRHPRVRVLALARRQEPAHVRAALAAGAAGCVLMEASTRELLSAVRVPLRGRQPETSVPTRHNPGGPRGRRAIALGDSAPLSPREVEVLHLLARGHTNREISLRIGVSVKTIETYRVRIGQKLGLRTRADIVRYALQAGFLLLPEQS